MDAAPLTVEALRFTGDRRGRRHCCWPRSCGELSASKPTQAQAGTRYSRGSPTVKQLVAKTPASHQRACPRQDSNLRHTV